MTWGTREQAAQHYSCSLSSVDRLRKTGIIRSAKIPELGIRIELLSKEKLAQKHLQLPSEVMVLSPKKKQKLDITLEEYIERNLKGGNSTLAKKRRCWNFGKKGVYERKLKKGNTWYFYYYDESGQRKRLSAPSASCMEDAVLAMEQKVREVFDKRHGVQDRTITFRRFAPIYLSKYAEIKKESHRTDSAFIKSRLIPHFGDFLLSEITSEHVSDFIAGFKPKRDYIRELKGSTINKHLQVLSRMFTIASKFGYETGSNPVDRELHFADETQYIRNRTLDDEINGEERLMDGAAPHMKHIIQCALLQAMRSQEILGLKVTDVDLEGEVPTITIRPEINKSGKEDIIPIRPRMRQIFKRVLIENGGRSEFVFNYIDPRNGEYRPITTCRRAFKAACRRAGIEGLQFRDLRRTCSTRLHEAGVDPLLIQRFLRHSSFRMTGQVYIQSSLKLMREAFDGSDKNAHSCDNLTHNWHTDNSAEKTATQEKTIKCLFSMN